MILEFPLPTLPGNIGISPIPVQRDNDLVGLYPPCRTWVRKMLFSRCSSQHSQTSPGADGWGISKSLGIRYQRPSGCWRRHFSRVRFDEFSFGCWSWFFFSELLPHPIPLVQKSKIDRKWASRETLQFMVDRNLRSGWRKIDTMVAHSKKLKISFDKIPYTFNAPTYLVPPLAFIRQWISPFRIRSSL